MQTGFTFQERRSMLVMTTAHEQKFQFRENGGITRCRAQDWVLDYSISDCGLCLSGGTPWLARTGGVAHLYPPETRYEEDHQNANPFHSAYILFRGESPELEKLIANRYHFARILDPERILQKLLQQCVRIAGSEANRGYFAAYAVFCSIQSLLFQLNPHDAEEGFIYNLSGKTGTSLRLKDEIRAELERNFASKITIAELAKKYHLSVSGLSHQYRQEAGETIFETLLRIRTEQSLPLLQRGKGLKEIAAATGFSDEFYYSKIFKRLYGESPRKLFPRKI